jgi:hypothetical protein
MDTNIFEFKRGGAITAYFIRQEPHAEDVNIKPPDASSDEERLAAGIAAIGLQT